MQVERLFALCRRYNLKVLLDIHAVQGSQNGFDNSGRTMNLEWTTFSSNKVTAPTNTTASDTTTTPLLLCC
jgi:glucan 1,3-beta-glucosidase